MKKPPPTLQQLLASLPAMPDDLVRLTLSMARDLGKQAPTADLAAWIAALEAEMAKRSGAQP